MRLMYVSMSHFIPNAPHIKHINSCRNKELIITMVHSLGKILAFALLHSILQGQICRLLQVFLDFLLLHSSPYNEKDSFRGCQFQKVLQVFIEPFNFSFFSVTGWGIDLNYCDTKWFALEMNRDHSVIFEIASKYCISGSFVDQDATPFLLRGSCPQQQI